MSAAPRLDTARLCRGCELEAAPDSLDCVECEAKRERKFYSRRFVSDADRMPDDVNDPSCWPDGMGRHGWRR